jgi:Domain of unknown function (DUF1772)
LGRIYRKIIKMIPVTSGYYSEISETAVKRGFIMQATLAVLSGVAGFFSYHATQNWVWGLGAVIILLNWPYTLLVIMPTNRKLTAVKDGSAGVDEVNRIVFWGKLHAIRTVLGLIAVVTFLMALTSY